MFNRLSNFCRRCVATVRGWFGYKPTPASQVDQLVSGCRAAAEQTTMLAHQLGRPVSEALHFAVSIVRCAFSQTASVVAETVRVGAAAAVGLVLGVPTWCVAAIIGITVVSSLLTYFPDLREKTATGLRYVRDLASNSATRLVAYLTEKRDNLVTTHGQTSAAGRISLTLAVPVALVVSYRFAGGGLLGFALACLVNTGVFMVCDWIALAIVTNPGTATRTLTDDPFYLQRRIYAHLVAVATSIQTWVREAVVSLQTAASLAMAPELATATASAVATAPESSGLPAKTTGHRARRREQRKGNNGPATG